MNMYTYQDSLPKLPLPPLEQTCANLLDWSRVFLYDSEFSQTRKAVDHFQSPEGCGTVLQHHLNDLAENPAFQNWLEPLWAESYLRNPAGLPLGSNVAYLLDKPPGTQAMPLPEYLAGRGLKKPILRASCLLRREKDLLHGQ